MNLPYYISELEKNRAVFEALLSNISDSEFLWKPAENKWSLLEILCHLFDEEREDFRQRVKSILNDPTIPLPPIDPPLWVIERKYLEQDYSKKLKAFLDERSTSVNWLKSLDYPKWSNVYHHPSLGAVSAGFFLSNWIAHDYLHIRQIIGLKYQFLNATSGEDLNYAGTW